MSKAPTGLRWRNGRAYVDLSHERFRDGRLAMSLRTSDPDRAVERLQTLKTLMERGEWAMIEHLRSGGLHITDVAAAVRDNRVGELKRGMHEAPVLADAVDAFLQTTEATTSARTYKTYRGACNLLVEHFGLEYEMDQLTREAAEAYLHGPKETAVGRVWAAHSIQSHRKIAAALWDHAIERDRERAANARLEGRLARNPWKDAKVPEVRQTRHVWLQPEEWLDLVDAVRGRPHLGLLTLAYRAGLRQQEATHLRTDVDIVLDGPEPVVKIQPREGQYSWKPKTSNSVRVVPLTPDAVELLREHRKHFAGERYFIRPSTEDKPLSPSACVKWTREAYEAVGIEYGREGDGCTLHTGRHTYASWLAQAGVPLNFVADLLGDTLQVVADTYAHLTPDSLRASAMVGFELVERAR